MSGLFGVLDVASRSLGVNQSQLRTTSHNISNVDTPGYSRQRVGLAAARPIEHPAGHLGTGVEQTTVERVTDEFIDRQLVGEQAAFGSTDVQAEALVRVEELLNEQQGPGIAAALAELYSGFSDLASSVSPGAAVEREAVRSTATTLINRLQRVDGELRGLQRGLDAQVVAKVSEINDLATRIASLNGDIVRQETTAPANDLRDQRDQLVRELARSVEVSSFEKPNGAVVVLLGGASPLVDGGEVRALQSVADPTNPFDPSFSNVVYDLAGVSIDVTSSIGGGELGGLLRARDTILPAAVRSLDTLAYNLAVQVNGVHAGGLGLDGTVGNFFSAPAAVEDAARTLALDPNVLARTDAIAAGLTTDPSDNRNALALAALRDGAVALFLPGDPPGPATGPARSLLDHSASVVADVGLQARSMQQSREQQAQTLELLENRRDSVSGVSIDEEVTNLIRLQAVFQANARVISTIDRLLGDVLSLI